MQTITFYSYKGGVGRTLALANVAKLLADLGRRVFVLDCDLEAPGLHYKLLTGEDKGRRERMKPGFIDLAFEYFRRDGFRPIAEYVEEIPAAAGGAIFLMPAGQPLSAAYWSRLVQVRLPSQFYGEHSEGFDFLMELKLRIEQEHAPDVLLVDARTGVTEVGGVALTLLPDKVVFLFVNNDESKEGTREVMRSITRTLPPEEKLPAVVPVLTRYPVAVEEKERAGETEAVAQLQGYFNESSSDDVKSPPIDRVLVLHSDRDLERKETIYLGDTEKKATVLFRDYYELFRALELASDEELATFELRALAQEAGAAAAREDYAKAVDLREQALAVAQRAFGTRHDMYAEAMHAAVEALDKLGRYEDALARSSALRALFLDLGVTDASKLGALARNIALFSARLGQFSDVPAELERAVRFAGAQEQETLLELLREVRRLYEAGKGVMHPSYSEVLRQLWTSLLSNERSDEAADVLRGAMEFFRSLRDEGRIDLASAQRSWAELLMKRKEYALAERELREVEKAYRLSFEAKDPRRGEVQAELADALRAQGRTKEADAAARGEEHAASRPRIAAPPERLPPRRPCLVRGGPEVVSFSVQLTVVTPILGGATRTREIDIIDVIRVPSLRGQLRFWWRALYGGQLSSEHLEHLYAAERRLWGGAGDESGGRSDVELRITVSHEGELDTSPINAYGRNVTGGAYALWPAREARGKNPQETAPRRAPGTSFKLEVRCPKRDEPAVRNAIRGLLLFGGVGGRTRRGVGSLTVELPKERAQWLPAAATREALTALFGEDMLTPLPGRSPNDLPILPGSGLRVGAPVQDPEAAWTTALDWLANFRQGQPSVGALGTEDERYARVRGDQRRPGRSNWPEADKVRRLAGRGPWAHAPRHGPDPVWPRAGFGLPIVSQFQGKDRSGAPYPAREPDNYELRWFEERITNRAGERPTKEWIMHDRLASPLIVKALPLSDGRFAPCALWLYRGYPNGKVGLKKDDPRPDYSRADFDLLVAPGDKARFAPLASGSADPQGSRLRTAFFRWLQGIPNLVVVAL